MMLNPRHHPLQGIGQGFVPRCVVWCAEMWHGSLLTLALRLAVFYFAHIHLSCSLIKHCCVSRAFPVGAPLKAVVQILAPDLSSIILEQLFKNY